jgi:hypothetical protein
MLRFKNTYYNTSLADLATNKKDIGNITMRYRNRLIRKTDPVFMLPTSRYGRAHFYAPVKIIGNYTIDTLVFNVIVLWFMSFVLYFTLYFDVIRRILSYIETVAIIKRSKE